MKSVIFRKKKKKKKNASVLTNYLHDLIESKLVLTTARCFFQYFSLEPERKLNPYKLKIKNKNCTSFSKVHKKWLKMRVCLKRVEFLKPCRLDSHGNVACKITNLVCC
jgi:Sec7-like guanine-nucleotide exchange factor